MINKKYSVKKRSRILTFTQAILLIVCVISGVLYLTVNEIWSIAFTVSLIFWVLSMLFQIIMGVIKMKKSIN